MIRLRSDNEFNQHLALPSTSTRSVAPILLGLALAIVTSIAAADTLCDSSVINKGSGSWSNNSYLYNCLANGGSNLSIVIPKQQNGYRVDVWWGGYDKSNGTPTGSINLVVGLDDPKITQIKHMPENGDDEKTWRWNGTTSIVVPAGVQKKFNVLHDTANGSGGNTYLRIKLISTE
jgi:hypothetical protein